MNAKFQGLKSRAINGTKWTSISTASTTGFAMIQMVVLSRLLRPSDIGLMSMVLVTVGFANAFADMGISNAFICHQNICSTHRSSLFWMNILAGFTVSIVFFIVSPLVAYLYHEEQLVNLMFWMAWIFPLTSIGQVFQVLLQKELHFSKLAVIEIVASFTNVFVSVACAFTNQGVLSLVWGQLSCAMVKAILFLSVGIKTWPIQVHFSINDVKPYIRFGLYQMGERIVFFLYINMDFLLVGMLLGAQKLGYYTFAFNLINTPISKINPVAIKVAIPIFSKIRNEADKLRQGYLKMLEILTLINFPLLIGIAITSDYLIPIVFGAKWTPSIVIIKLLAGVGLMRSLINPVGALFIAKNRPELGFKWNLSLLLAQLPGIYIGLYLFDIQGVALSFLLLQAIYTVLNYTILIRSLLGRCLKEYLSSIANGLLLSGIMAISTYLFALTLKSLRTSNSTILIMQILLGIAVYISLLLFIKRTWLNNILNSLVGKKTQTQVS